MEIVRDRLALIKRIHLGLEKIKKPKAPKIPKPKLEKPRRAYVIKTPRPKMSPEERLARRLECQKVRVAKWKSEGLCLKCGAHPIHIAYQYAGHTLHEERMAFCIKHCKQPFIMRPLPVRAVQKSDEHLPQPLTAALFSSVER